MKKQWREKRNSNTFQYCAWGGWVKKYDFISHLTQQRAQNPEAARRRGEAELLLTALQQAQVHSRYLTQCRETAVPLRAVQSG